MSKLRKYQVEASKRDLLTPKDTIAAVKKSTAYFNVSSFWFN